MLLDELTVPELASRIDQYRYSVVVSGGDASDACSKEPSLRKIGVREISDSDGFVVASEACVADMDVEGAGRQAGPSVHSNGYVLDPLSVGVERTIADGRVGYAAGVGEERLGSDGSVEGPRAVAFERPGTGGRVVVAVVV